MKLIFAFVISILLFGFDLYNESIGLGVFSQTPSFPKHNPIFPWSFTAIGSKENWFYMKAPQKITHKEVVKDVTKLKANSKIDNGMLQGLIGEEGFMRAGAMPSISTASAAGSKQILDAVAKASAPKKG